MYAQLLSLGCNVSIVDPCADVDLAKRVYGVDILPVIPKFDFACVILVVNHDYFAKMSRSEWLAFKSKGSFLVDIKSSIIPRDLVDFRV